MIRSLYRIRALSKNQSWFAYINYMGVVIRSDRNHLVSSMMFHITLSGDVMALSSSGQLLWKANLGSAIHGVFLVNSLKPLDLPKR